MHMKKILFGALGVCLALTLVTTSGCKKKNPPPVTKFPAGATGQGTDGMSGSGTDTSTAFPSGVGPGSTTIPGPIGELPGHQGLEGMVPDRTAFQPYTVYFEFDRSALIRSEQPKAEAVANALKAKPNTKVQIEGHCDERGTEEYNRALGERRALAIREFLMNLGIEGHRVFTISYGEDKPAVDSHSDEAWAKNRRGEFILYSPPN